MRYSRESRFRAQFDFLRRQFLQDGELPFSDALSTESVEQALQTIDVQWRDRIYTPVVTLWVFLAQVISADHSCRAAVARLLSHRALRGETPCSSETGAYCQARKRLPEEFYSTVACQTGKKLDAEAKENWLWKKRRVYMFDGSTVTMPDTSANQQAYPQVYNQAPGVGFPIARIAAIISLSCGAIVDLGICRYAGKGQGEVSLLRKLWGFFRRGDVMLTDCLMCNWTELVMLQQRGVDTVTRLNRARRRADFRRGKRLGKDDHIVRWPKPTKPRSIAYEVYKLLPDFLTVREIRFHVKQRGFRTKTIIVVTTLLDAKKYSKEDLALLYRARWNQELDLRSIKITMQMDVLRCKTPELVRKEIWTHVLAYNLIHTIMAQSAERADVLPRSVSFKATIQVLEAFQPIIAAFGRRSHADRMTLYEQMLHAIAVHRVADRPDRIEPRRKKRRPKKYFWLVKSRQETKRDLLKGIGDTS